MGSEFSRHPNVEVDFIEIRTHIARDNPEAAERFLKSANKTIELLATFPDMGDNYQTKTLKLQGLLMFPVSKPFRKYLIFYRIVEGRVRILYVKHGMRQLEERLKEDVRE